MSLCTWGLSSQTICPSTVNSISELGKAAMTLSRLTKWVWSNNKLSDHTKVNVYKACVISTLLYGSQSWRMRAHQEKRLNVFHVRCLRRILGITWQEKVTNKVVLEKAGIPSLYTLLKQRRMRRLGQVTRMKDDRIPKDILYDELATGKRPTGRPQLRFKDICKRDLQALGIITQTLRKLLPQAEMPGDTQSKCGYHNMKKHSE